MPPVLAKVPSLTELSLPGIAADNLLAMLATLGLLRALDAARPLWRARVSWKGPPFVAQLHLAEVADQDAVAQAAVEGIKQIAERFDVDDRKNVDFSPEQYKAYAQRLRGRPIGAALAATLTAGAPTKKDGGLRAGPLVMLFGQGHQNFLDRLMAVSGRLPAGKIKDGKDAKADATTVPLEHPLKIKEALFAPWVRRDQTDAFRWDPQEDQRYALRHANPSKSGAAPTVHGANRLAVLGFLSFVCVPHSNHQRAAGWTGKGFAWPIWTSALSLRAIEALLVHPDVIHGHRDKLRPLGVAEVYYAERISNGKFMNVAAASPYQGTDGG